MEKELCVHCGASMMMNKYTLNKTLLRSLVKIAMNPGKPARECSMNKSEFANYTKLKYWGLIQKLEDGLWTITPTGTLFLRGDLDLYEQVVYFRDKAVRYDGKFVNAFSIVGSEESKQKYREMMESYL